MFGVRFYFLEGLTSNMVSNLEEEKNWKGGKPEEEFDFFSSRSHF